MTISVFRPSYTEAEAEAVSLVLQSGWSGLGPRTAEFESLFARYYGVKHAIALNSGTAALHMALQLSGVSAAGLVLCPSLTFVSTAHAIRYLGAHPIFVDTDPKTLLMCPTDMARKISAYHGNIDAIIHVLYGGQPSTIDGGSFPVIYDCAHACGSKFDPRGKLCCWSFHAVKNLSTGEGGMLTTDDDQLALRARRLRWMGISTSTYDRNYDTGHSVPRYKWNYDVDEIGFKYNMSDIQAAIGIVQLQRLGGMQARRANLMWLYEEGLRSVPAVTLFEHLPGSSYHLCVIRCPDRDALFAWLGQNHVSAGVHYRPIHLYRCYGLQAPLPTVERVWTELLTLPLYPDLLPSQVEEICDLIKRFYAGQEHYQPGT